MGDAEIPKPPGPPPPPPGKPKSKAPTTTPVPEAPATTHAQKPTFRSVEDIAIPESQGIYKKPPEVDVPNDVPEPPPPPPPLVVPISSDKKDNLREALAKRRVQHSPEEEWATSVPQDKGIRKFSGAMTDRVNKADEVINQVALRDVKPYVESAPPPDYPAPPPPQVAPSVQPPAEPHEWVRTMPSPEVLNARKLADERKQAEDKAAADKAAAEAAKKQAEAKNIDFFAKIPAFDPDKDGGKRRKSGETISKDANGVKATFDYSRSSLLNLDEAGILKHPQREYQKLDAQITDLVGVALRDFNKGTAANPIHIQFPDGVEKPELALKVLMELKKQAMAQGKEFYVKDPNDPNKTIKITPDEKLSPDELGAFKYYAEKPASLTQTADQTGKHCIGYQILKHEVAGLDKKKEKDNPSAFLEDALQSYTAKLPKAKVDTTTAPEVPLIGEKKGTSVGI